MQKVRAGEDTGLCASVKRLITTDQKLKEQYRNAPPASQMPHKFKCMFS